MAQQNHPRYGEPRVPDAPLNALPGSDGSWIFAHSLGEPYSGFYAVDNKCRIFSLSKRDFVTPNVAGKISFGCGVGRSSKVNGPIQRVALEVAIRSYFPDSAPPDPTKQFRLVHIDGDHQNNSIFNLRWTEVNAVGIERKKEIHWPEITADELRAAQEQTRSMYGAYKVVMRREPPPATGNVIQHSVSEYGTFIDEWRPVILEGLEDGLYLVNARCQMWSLRLGRLVQPSEQHAQTLLSNVSENAQFRVNARYVALRSFYPQKHDAVVAANAGIARRDVTVDHVNGDHSDDHLENMQFLTRSENAIKGAGPGVRVVRVKATKEDLPGEVWKTSAALETLCPRIKASNYGRVMKIRGGKSCGSRIKNAPKHSAIQAKDVDGRFRPVLVSHIVFAAFNNEFPPTKESGMRIFHNPDAPLTEAGTYRNYPEDLTLKSVSDLLRETWAKRKRVAAAEDGGGVGDAQQPLEDDDLDNVVLLDEEEEEDE
jgi:hypothetical protein